VGTHRFRHHGVDRSDSAGHAAICTGGCDSRHRSYGRGDRQPFDFLGIEVQGDKGLLFGLALTVVSTSSVTLFLHRNQIPVIGKRF
jgi:hypothetical protein